MKKEIRSFWKIMCCEILSYIKTDLCWFNLILKYDFIKKRKIVFFNFIYNNCHIIKRGTIVAIQLELKKNWDQVNAL